ncbi:MAG: MFS transporter [Chloroflexota bacterium]
MSHLIESMEKRFSFYYGWVVVGVCSLTLFVMFGIRLSFSVFFVALIDEFGWSRADTSLIFSTTMLVFMLGSAVAGWAQDRLGARVTFSLGAFVLGLGLVLSSQISTLLGMVLSYGFIAGIGITILGLSNQASVIARWFRQRRGLAIGIAFAGTGLGSLVVTPLMAFVAERFHWRIGYSVLAGLAFLLIPLILWLLKDKPSAAELEKGNQLPKTKKTAVSPPLSSQTNTWPLRKVFRTPSFWLLILAGLCTMGPIRMLTVHQLAMMTDAGISTATGAQAVGLVGAVTAVSYILSGILSDKIGRIPTYALGGIATVAALYVIGSLSNGSPQLVWLYAVLLGIGEGSRSSLVATVSSDMFAGPTLGAINGAVGSAYGAGTTVLP